MNSKELNTLLLERIPTIKEAFDEETSWQEGNNSELLEIQI